MGPPSAIATLKPDRLSQVRIARRVCRSSSTTRMRRMTASFAVSNALQDTTGNTQPGTHNPGRICPRHNRRHYRFVLRISALFTFPTQIGQSVCPPQCIRMIVQPCAIGSGNFARTEIRHAVTQLMRDRSSSRLRQEKECKRYRAHPIVCSRLCLRRSSNHCIRTSKPWNWPREPF